jgi:hypothetical protein
VPYTSAQIVTLATQIAKVPGFTSQAGQFLNKILEDLCLDYDLEVARSVATFTFNGNYGPYPLSPTTGTYLRARKGMVFYTYSGVPYFPNPIDLAEFDALVQIQNNDFPRVFTTDMAGLSSYGTPNMFFWPAPSIVVPVTVRCYVLMPDITTPETSSTIPWFPNQNYLITELSGRLCQLAGDDRWEAFLSDNEETHPGGSKVLLRKYLQMKDDPEGKTDFVSLDRRRFGQDFNRLPNTKNIGW